MNTIIKMTFVLNTFLFYSIYNLSVANATQSKAEKPLTALVEVIVLDTAILNEGTIDFTIYMNRVNSNYSSKKQIYHYRITNSKEHFSIPLSSELTYGKIFYNYTNKKPEVSNTVYLFQSGDRIQILLEKNKVTFKGEGSDKFNAIYEASKIDYKLSNLQTFKINGYLKKSDHSGFLKARMEIQDSIYQINKEKLSKYKPNLSSSIYNRLLADIWGEHNRALVDILFATTLIKDMGTSYNNAVKEAYVNYTKNFNSEYLSEMDLTNSYKYCDFLMRKEILLENFYNKKNIDSKLSPFAYLYHSILTNYHGGVRDKLILLASYSGRANNKDLELFKDKAISKIGDSKYKQALITHLANLKGKALPFELPDQNGKIYKLSDFKEKLVVIDFWFTGCQGCVQMAKKLKPIILHYKANPNVAFISISIDGEKYKDNWLNSLKNETYSSKDELNLLAVDGLNSDFIKHYNILSYPRLILISKDGNIISANPPDPRINGSDFKSYIDQNL